MTFTVVPRGTELRIGIDRDQDGFLDRDEFDNCGDPADPFSIPFPRGDVNLDGQVGTPDLSGFVLILLTPEGATSQQRCLADLNLDGIPDGSDIQPFVTCIVTALCPP